MELRGTGYPTLSLLEGMSLEMETGNLIALWCVTERPSIKMTYFHRFSICWVWTSQFLNVEIGFCMESILRCLRYCPSCGAHNYSRRTDCFKPLGPGRCLQPELISDSNFRLNGNRMRWMHLLRWIASSVDILTTFAHPLCHSTCVEPKSPCAQVWREEAYGEKQEPQPKPKPQLSQLPQRNRHWGCLTDEKWIWHRNWGNLTVSVSWG